MVLFSKSVYILKYLKQSCTSYLNATILQNFPLLNNTVIIAVSVMLTVILEITCGRIFMTARNSQSILALRASKINFNKTACLLMMLAIDSVVLGCCIYKDVWSAEMDSK